MITLALQIFAALIGMALLGFGWKAVADARVPAAANIGCACMVIGFLAFIVSALWLILG